MWIGGADVGRTAPGDARPAEHKIILGIPGRSANIAAPELKRNLIDPVLKGRRKEHTGDNAANNRPRERRRAPPSYSKAMMAIERLRPIEPKFGYPLLPIGRVHLPGVASANHPGEEG
jgi:hypothetical protein